MLRKMKSSVLAIGALALMFHVAPLAAQTAPSTTASAATAKATKAVKSSAASVAAAPSTVVAPPQKGMVWVNTASGAYHREGTKFYGKTEQGKYMTEADAQKAGYHIAKNEAKQ